MPCILCRNWEGILNFFPLSPFINIYFFLVIASCIYISNTSLWYLVGFLALPDNKHIMNTLLRGQWWERFKRLGMCIVFSLALPDSTWMIGHGMTAMNTFKFGCQNTATAHPWWDQILWLGHVQPKTKMATGKPVLCLNLNLLETFQCHIWPYWSRIRGFLRIINASQIRSFQILGGKLWIFWDPKLWPPFYFGFKCRTFYT